ncbi:hypothetical protein [Streptomyces sp. ODS28]|uniref:hypothetical protein n=1 Tax=Streptomyces sp. ODS28 TaxID=3136688 RepID=UPI0031EFC90B
MISFITTTKMTDHSVVASCLLGSRLRGTGLPGVVLGGNERPTKALAAVAMAPAQEQAYAADCALAGAGVDSQKTQTLTQQHHMWAFRGPDPWRYPA